MYCEDIIGNQVECNGSENISTLTDVVKKEIYMNLSWGLNILFHMVFL